MIKSALEQHGYIIQEFENHQNLVKNLEFYGNLCLQTEVKIDRSKTSLIYSNQEMEFHNDEYLIDWIAWFCHDPGLENEFTYLIPKAELYSKINKIDKNTLNLLSKSFCKTYDCLPNGKCEASIWQSSRLYFVPWMIKEPNKATETLKKIISKCTYEKIRLQPNQTLIISNKFCLHGRSALNANSPRHLTRHWVRLHE